MAAEGESAVVVIGGGVVVVGGGGGGLFVGRLTSQQQASVSRDGSALTVLRAATVRYKLQIRLSTLASHSMLTLG